MDPMTGSILAWALYPTFDPNHFRKLSAKDWRNRAVTDPYEPGSTLKVVLAAAALEERVMEPDTLLYGGDGQMPVAGTIVHDPAKSSWMTFSEALVRSSNVGAIKVAVELGRSRVFAYLKAFGFGEKTGIDLSGESPGILHHPDTWSGRSLSSLALGQEVAVTPIQMVTAMSVVANGGWLMTDPNGDRDVCRGERGMAYDSRRCLFGFGWSWPGSFNKRSTAQATTHFFTNSKTHGSYS
jgi:cell division protein FtsI (penicillin-binding protein 3)